MPKGKSKIPGAVYVAVSTTDWAVLGTSVDKEVLKISAAQILQPPAPIAIIKYIPERRLAQEKLKQRGY